MLQFKEKWPKFQIVNQRYEQQDNNYRYYQHSKPRPSYQPQPYWFFCSHVKTRGMRFKPVPEFKQPASHSHVQKTTEQQLQLDLFHRYEGTFTTI